MLYINKTLQLITKYYKLGTGCWCCLAFKIYLSIETNNTKKLNSGRVKNLRYRSAAKYFVRERDKMIRNHFKNRYNFLKDFNEMI